MRIMGIDLGEKRVGIALSDDSQTLATPFTILERTSMQRLLARLSEIVQEQQVEAVVIGFPRSLNGEVGPQARLVAGEAERIQEHLRVPMTLWDERFTTVRSEQMLVERGGKFRNARKRPAVDAMVAAIILQEYLDARHETADDPFFE